MLIWAHRACNRYQLTHLSPHSLGQLSQVLRGSLGLVRVRRVSIYLRVRGMLANMMWWHARGGRGLLVLCHSGCLRLIWLQCDVCATEAATVLEWFGGGQDKTRATKCGTGLSIWMSQEMEFDGCGGEWIRTVGRGSASCKRTDGCESRRGEAGAERDSSAQRNTDGVDPDLDLQCWMGATMWPSSPRGGVEKERLM
jgi:hypothetical protein